MSLLVKITNGIIVASIIFALIVIPVGVIGNIFMEDLKEKQNEEIMENEGCNVVAWELKNTLLVICVMITIIMIVVAIWPKNGKNDENEAIQNDEK